MAWLRKAGFDVPTGLQNVIAIDPAPGVRSQPGALYPDSSYQAFASQGFGRNELVYGCIMEKASSLPQGIVRAYPRGGHDNVPIDNHPLRRLLAHPNPIMDEFQFFELGVVYLDLSGTLHWLIVRDRTGAPAQLWPLRPDLVRILPSGRPYIYDYGYVIDPTTSSNPTNPEIIPIPFEDVIAIKYPNPLDAYFGQAPMRAAARAISVDNVSSDFVDTLLRNDATPRTVVMVQEALDEALIDVLKTKWKQRFSGANRGAPAFLQAGMDVKVLGLNMSDLEFPDLRSVNESRICMVFGVPPILVGAKVGLDRSTFSNYREARAAFWAERLMPLQRRFIEPIRSRLVPEFSGVGRPAFDVAWDNSEVLALQEAESVKWERATNALARGGIMLNDFRKIVGLDAVDSGDCFLLPAGVVPLGKDEPIEEFQKEVLHEVTPPASGGPPPAKPISAPPKSYAEQYLSTISRNGKEPSNAS